MRLTDLHETVNHDVFNPAFNDTQIFDGLTYRATSEEDHQGKPYFVIRVYDDAFVRVGLVKFALYKDDKGGEWLESLISAIQPEYQGKGIASNIYAYARMLGNTIKPSSDQTQQGRAMWTGWEKSGAAKHLTSNESKFSDYERAVMEGGHSLDKQRTSALRQAVKQVNEIERIPQSSFSGNDDEYDDEYDDEDGEETQVELHKLPGNNKFMYSAEKVNNTSNGPGMEVAIWSDDETVIGELTLTDANHFPFKNALQVDTIAVDKQYRSQGIGTSLYGIVLSILKKTLLAGESQTPGGRKMWMALSSIPGVEVKGYVSIHSGDLRVPQFPSYAKGTNEFEREVDQKIDIIMGQLGGQYIGDNSQGNKHYFAFDVIPSTGELAPAVKTALSKIYINDDDYDNNDDYEFGLYAVWNGAVNENFADGKVKGKSRPGRVKRSGASCDGSVSDLRSKAKNASGERAKMYHWCANMKSGRTNESEILDDLEEGWKDWVAGAALGAAALSPQTADAKSAPQQKPTITQQVQGDAAYATKLILKPEAKILIQTARAAGMRGKELAQFVAQCAHETANFSSLKELGGRLDFKKYDPKFNPRKAKMLGNKQVGDGAKYLGRGYIQLTGRDNYKRAGQALGLPLEEQPELVERPDIAAKVAVWFWQNQVAPKVSNFNDTASVTKPINSGLKGLQDRHNKFASIMALMSQKS